jgi:hypothetical protein
VAALKTYPLLLHFGTHIAENPGDPLLVTWILAWDYQALTTDPWNLFNANILYPAEHTLAFSEHLLGVLPIFALPYVLTGNPIFAYNTVFFLSFVLSGIAMFLLVHYWTHNFWSALIAGLLFAFAPIRFGKLGHLHLLNLYWAPLAFLFLERFLRSKRWQELAVCAMFYWLQILSSVYLGWFTTIAVALYVLYALFFMEKGLLSRSLIPKYAAFAASTLLLLLPIHLPYVRVAQQWGVARSLQDCIGYSADLLLSPLSVPYLLNDLYVSSLQFASATYTAVNEKLLFPGFVMPLLVTLGSFAQSRLLAYDKIKHMRRVFGLIAIASFVLALGPSLLILGRNTHIPLPYRGLYHVLPGFNAMRVPARFGLMAVLATSVLASLGFLQAWRSLGICPGFRRLASPICQAMIAGVILTLFLLELGFKPLPLVKIQTGHEIPEVYRWLASKHLNGPIVELPFGLWQDYQYTYFSTYHWLPIVNGSSGFAPPSYFQITSELNALPSRQAVEYLHALGVQGLVVHTDRLAPHEAQRWQQALLHEQGLEQVVAFGSDIVYKITSRLESTHQLHVELTGPDQLPRRSRVSLGMLAREGDRRFWVHPRPLGQTRAIVEWQEQGAESTFVEEKKIVLPIAISAEEVAPLSLSVRTPPSPGRYLLKLHFPALDVSPSSKVVEITAEAFFTSLNAPHLLSAAYTLQAMRTQVPPSEPLGVVLRVANTGGAVWLAQTQDGRGEVRFGWRWFKGDQMVFLLPDRERLPYDIFPGQLYEFKTRIPTPSAPGEYILELGLVSELVTWFFDRGVEPVKVTMHVR